MERNYEYKESKKEIKIFREKHDCKHCFLFEKPRRCIAMNMCPLDELYKHREVKIREIKTCLDDEDGNCPYANEVGTCFGFCLRKIIKELRERKQGHEQAKEDKEDG